MSTQNKFEQAARALKALEKLDAREAKQVAAVNEKFAAHRSAVLLGCEDDVAALVMAERGES